MNPFSIPGGTGQSDSPRQARGPRVSISTSHVEGRHLTLGCMALALTSEHLGICLLEAWKALCPGPTALGDKRISVGQLHPLGAPLRQRGLARLVVYSFDPEPVGHYGEARATETNPSQVGDGLSQSQAAWLCGHLSDSGIRQKSHVTETPVHLGWGSLGDLSEGPVLCEQEAALSPDPLPPPTPSPPSSSIVWPD